MVIKDNKNCNQMCAHHSISQFNNKQHMPKIITIFICFLLVITACTIPYTSSPPSTIDETSQPQISPSSPTALPESEITFRVEIPENTPDNQSLSFILLDEVTGLALNMRSIPMDAEDDLHYSITLSLPVGTVIKYRYSRMAPTAPIEEHLSDGRQLRYRMYHVEGPGIVQDYVSRWTDTSSSGETGRISGYVIDATTGSPAPNLLVIAGGVQTLTASDGSYLLEGLTPGLLNLTVYSLDGSYRVFQQGALVAAESTTQAEIRLQPAPLVNVTFKVTVPDDTIPAVPIRIAGNLLQFGNTFADLTGGVSTIASRMPTLNLQPDGEYELSLKLPAGAYIKYFYTLGDGYWNTEHLESGDKQIREMFVPESDTTVGDRIEAWSDGGSSPITFDVTVPSNTPQSDRVSIQFKPLFGWTEPIPMWQIGENRWAYILLSPMKILGNISYRYCRNEQCGFADDANTFGLENSGYPINPGLLRQTIIDKIDSWYLMENYPPPKYEGELEVLSRGDEYISGIEFQAGYHPGWIAHMPQAFANVKSLGANWIIFAPTWSLTRNSPPILELVPSVDILWDDTAKILSLTKDHGLNTAIYPNPRFPIRAADWWRQGQRDFSWWVVWFERYRNFIIHYADFAKQSESQIFILGGDWIGPALPNGTLSDGSPSGVPADAELRWRELIQEIRAHYNGRIAWAVSSIHLNGNVPSFVDMMDLIYLEVSAPLASHIAPTQEEILVEAGNILDSYAFPIVQKFNKPLIVGLSYLSVDGAVTGCLPDQSDGHCLEMVDLARPRPDLPGFNLDLGEQADIYLAFLSAVNQRNWVSGFVSRGYYPPTALQDKSMSVHGKPAQELLRYWYPRFLGTP